MLTQNGKMQVNMEFSCVASMGDGRDDEVDMKFLCTGIVGFLSIKSLKSGFFELSIFI